MKKVYHNFQLDEKSKVHRSYKEDDTCIRLDFIDENMLRVAVYNEGDRLLPTFNINPANEFSIVGRDRLSLDGFPMYIPKSEVYDEGEIFSLGSGITVKVQEGEFALSYFQNDILLFSDRNPYPYNFGNEFGHDRLHYISRQEGECIFGLGDKGGDLNKAGRAFRIETADSMGYNAKTTDILYKHIPFYICENTVGCYGIFYDTAASSYMDLGNEINNYYEPYKYFKTEDNCLVYYVFFGTKLQILKSFSYLCGKQAFPPKWSFDYCASTMAYTDAPDSENQMNIFLDKVKRLGFSCGGFYLSSGYTSIGKGRYVFNWNKDKFPEPDKFIRKFSDSGIEIIPNIKPAFLTSHPMYDEMANRGLFIKNPDGTPFVTRFWDGNGSYLDFTNGEAYNFWKSQVEDKLLSFGIKATWNDNNEYDVKDDDALCVGYGKGNERANLIRSHFTQLMVMSSYEAQIEKHPEIRPFLSSRSGCIGMRRLAQTWSGDNRTAFEDLRYCHNIGLTMSMSGLSFYGHDLGGFSGDMPSRELLLRWLQHGVFEPRMTVHSWNKDGSATMPWSYPDILDGVRKIFAQRKRLLPYLYSTAYKSVQNNDPINSPLFLYYDDKKIPTESNSILFGRDILVTFVFDEGERKADVYLPDGDSWYFEEMLFEGGQKFSIDIPVDEPVPFFVRWGSVIPEDIGEYGFGSEENIVFTVFPKDEGTYESEFFTDDGESFGYLKGECVKLKFAVTCDEREVRVKWKNEGKMPFVPYVKLTTADSRRFICEPM